MSWEGDTDFIDTSEQDDFAQNIVDDTLDQIASQEDDKQELTLHGSLDYSVNSFDRFDRKSEHARSFVQSRRHLVVGPVQFETTFRAPPDVTFGQVGIVIQGEVSGAGPATDYTPFLVQPYVYQWTYTNGEVAGLWIGLYALTTPPGINGNQKISWSAAGFASRYMDVQQDEAWTETYDYNDADYLTEDSGEDFETWE